MSDGPGSLAAALAQLQTQLPHVAKNATNPHFRSKYADLAAISAALLPLLGKLGLSFTCRPTMSNGSFVLAYALTYQDGERMSGEYPLPATGTPQAIGSAITYGRRYCLCAVTGLAADEDDDGNEASGTAGNSQKPATTTRGIRPTQSADARRAAAADTTATRADRERYRAEERAVADAKTPARLADRTKGPIPAEENPWENVPAEDRPGSISRGQQRAIEALLTKAGEPAGAAGREARHGALSVVLGLPDVIGSTNGLTYSQGAEAIRRLSALTGDEKMPQTVPDHAQRAGNDDLWAGTETR